MLKKIHLWIGIIGLIVFILSGQYFKHVLDGLQGLDNTPRLLLRTSHVYLFLTSVINLVFGLYYVQPEKVRWPTIYNQSLIMLAPFLIAYSFILDNHHEQRYRPTIHCDWDGSDTSLGWQYGNWQTLRAF